MKILSFLLMQAVFTGVLAGTGPVGVFEDHADVGSPKHAGTVSYDAGNQTYTLKGSGYNIWFERDEFQYAYRKIKGDFIITANFAFVGKGNNMHRKIGWMVRESLDDKASHYSAVLHGDGLTVLQWRPLRGAFMRDPQDEIFATKGNYQILQLERAGKRIILRAAHVGEPLQEIGSQEMTDMPGEVLAGLFICSHDPEITEEAKVWNVRIDKPVPDGYDPDDKGYIGCRLETMNVFDGTRKVIRESKGRFEAPNWMPDGTKLLFNEGGSLYTIPIDGGTPEKVNTGSANNLNNDHGISFDGKKLAISSHRPGLPGGGSTVYVLPLAGGTPRQITEGTPSYFHGWSGDSKEVYYVAQRDTPVYNVYKCAIEGGKEVQLTFNKSGHVDGPEGSPDGKYIYYNGSQSGTMQLWRMKPDGTGKEQITFDEYNNWFPHVSPDGKWIAFISFSTDVSPADHPSYKRVMLRLMPAAGGAPRVIAYLYGGQGTINVPSWSPDNKHIAFVSNSE
jgi:TolB protein